MGEADPSGAHHPRHRQGALAAAGHRRGGRGVRVGEHQGDLQAVRRAQTAVHRRRLPQHLIEEHRRTALGGLQLGDLGGAAAEAGGAVGPHQEEEVRGRGRGIDVPIELDRGLAVALADRLDHARGEPRLVEVEGGFVAELEQGHLGQVGPDHQRHVRRKGIGDGVEGVAREAVAVADGAEAAHAAAHPGAHREIGVHQPGQGHGLQIGGAGAGNAQLRQQGFGRLGRFRRLVEGADRAALHHRPVEQAVGPGHGQHRGHFAAAAGLPEDHHPVGVAAEALDILPHPLQGCGDVQHAGVARAGELRAQDLAQIGVAQDVQAVGDVDHHHLAAPGQLAAVVARVGARTGGVAAAMQPDHHGPL